MYGSAQWCILVFSRPKFFFFFFNLHEFQKCVFRNASPIGHIQKQDEWYPGAKYHLLRSYSLIHGLELIEQCAVMPHICCQSSVSSFPKYGNLEWQCFVFWSLEAAYSDFVFS